MRTKHLLLQLAAVFTAVFSVSLSTGAGTAHAASTGCLPGVIKKRLNQIRKSFGPIKVISAHRPGARIAGSGKPSYHSSCRAADFHPPAGKYRQVVSWLQRNHNGGIGTYSCGMNHVHIDNGPRVRFHRCVSGNRKGRGLARRAQRRQEARRTRRTTAQGRPTNTRRLPLSRNVQANRPNRADFRALGYFGRNKRNGG